MNHFIEDLNYYSDRRVTCRDNRWYNSLDENRMVAIATLDDEDVEVPFTWEVCPTCNGKGSHVNPSIDCNGLSASDFAEDPDFAESYMRGDYDQPCNDCGGRRVVPECADEAYLEKIEDHCRCIADMNAEYEAERRFGA